MVETSLQILQYKVLGHNSLGLTEIRRFSHGSEWCKTAEEFEAKSSSFLKEAVYCGINPRDSQAGKAENVKFITCIVIDIDPVRPRDTASSDEQHDEALAIGRRISGDYKGSIVVDSGSGCHLYFPVEPTAIADGAVLTKSLQSWFKELRTKYGTKTQKIDHIFDLPRVIRLWGSLNTRSNRVCTPITDVVLHHRFKLSDLIKPEPIKPSAVVSPVADALNDRFGRLCMTNGGLRNIVQSVSKFESRSEADFAFISHLVRAHFSADEIKSLMVMNPMGRKEESKDSDVDRVVRKITEAGLDTVSMVHGADRYFKGLDDRKPGISTGFRRFDEMVSGLKGTKVIVFAARPTEGKTTLAVQICANIADQGKPVLMFPTEVGHEPIYDKIISRKSGVGLKQFQTGSFNKEEREKVNAQREYVSKLPLFICEDFSLDIKKVEQKIREIAPSVVALDYIQAMHYNARTPGDLAVEMSNTVIKLKELASVHNIPILLFSQLKRSEGKHDLSMLKGSGALEEFTDIISFLYSTDKFIYPRKTDLVIMKSKYSEIGEIHMNFFSGTARFEEAEIG